MRNAHASQWSGAVLALIAAGLGWALWDGIVAPVAEPPGAHSPGMAASAVVPAVVPPGAEAVPVEAWAGVVLERPLFDPRRRPGVVEAMLIATETPRLTGVLISPQERLAIFAGFAGGAPLVVHEGGAIGSFVVQAIRPGEAVLVGPQGPRLLRPEFERNGAATRPYNSGPDR